MNIKSILTLTTAALVLASASTYAEETSRLLTFRGKFRTTTESGRFVDKIVGETDIVRFMAQRAGLGTTNLSRFALVYVEAGDYNGDAIRVVWRKTGQVVAQPFRLLFQKSITNGEGRRDEKMAVMFTENGTETKGSAVLVKKPFVRNDGSLGPDIITGQYQVYDDVFFKDRKAIATGYFIAGREITFN